MRGGLHPTPDIIAAAYEYLRACPPFRRWNLPHADAVAFLVTKNKIERGHMRKWPDRFEIGVSMTNIGNSDWLIRTLAHEMVHMRQRLIGDSKCQHGASFEKLAAQVCRYHGFDPKLF